MKKILGYTDVWSVAPGGTVNVKVSTYGPERYRADLVRVICGDDDPDHGIFLEGLDIPDHAAERRTGHHHELAR